MPTIDEIDAQIRALDEQKKQIKQKAKDAALAKANAAIEELRTLGYSYRLAEMEGTARAPRASGGTRRTGIRDQVLAVVKGSPDGISASDVLTKLNASDDTEKTSIRNALAALKRTDKVSLKDGSYFAA